MFQKPLKGTKMPNTIDTSSLEYVTWMAAVWKANAERNKQIVK